MFILASSRVGVLEVFDTPRLFAHKARFTFQHFPGRLRRTSKSCLFHSINSASLFSVIIDCLSAEIEFFIPFCRHFQHEFFNKSLRWCLISMKIWFKIHIKLCSVVYTVGARMSDVTLYTSLAPSPEFWTGNSSRHTLHGFLVFSRFRVENLKRHNKREKNCYMRLELNFYYNEVLAVFFLLPDVFSQPAPMF